MSRGIVGENGEVFFFLDGMESGHMLLSAVKGQRVTNYRFGRLEKCLTFSS
jgi:hypothetical protein